MKMLEMLENVRNYVIKSAYLGYILLTCNYVNFRRNAANRLFAFVIFYLQKPVLI